MFCPFVAQPIPHAGIPTSSLQGPAPNQNFRQYFHPHTQIGHRAVQHFPAMPQRPVQTPTRTSHFLLGRRTRQTPATIRRLTQLSFSHPQHPATPPRQPPPAPIQPRAAATDPQPTLSTGLTQRIEETIRSSCAEGTHSKDRLAVRQFLDFCQDNSIQERFYAPASEQTLCAFVATLSGGLAGGTIRGKVSSLKKWHQNNGWPWYGAGRLRTVVKGAENNAPQSSRKPPREPVTKEMIDILHEDLDPSHGLSAATLLIADTLFHGQGRGGELMPASPDWNKFDERKHPTAKDVGETISEKGSRWVRLPYTKTTGFRGDRMYMPAQLGSSCPISSFRNTVEVNRLSSSKPLASYRTADGTRKILTKSLFMRVCNQVWTSRGFKRRTVHCFRIGGTAHLLSVAAAPAQPWL